MVIIMAKNKKKRRSQAPIALVYFSTMVVFILIFGAIAIGLMNKMVLEPQSLSSSSSVEDSTPTDENNQTFFYMVKDDGNKLETAMLARFMPADGKILIVPLSPYTTASADGTGQTINQIFQSSGAAETTKAVSETLDISIDRYMSMGQDCFENLCDNFGSITYEVIENMYYVDKNSDDIVNYSKGDKISLQGSQIRMFITYPKYKDGNSQNVLVAGEFMKSLINSGFKLQTTRDNLDSIYSNLMKESSEKNFSVNDFEETKEFYYYVMDNFDNPADMLTPTGTWSEKQYKFTFDEAFKTQLKSAFKIEQ